MPIALRGAVWWIDIRHAGRRIRRSAGTPDRHAAQELHDRIKAQLWREARLGEARYTWNQAVKRWLSEHAHKRSLADDRDRLRWLSARLAGKALSEIGADLVKQLSDEKAAEWVHGRIGTQRVSAATINRHLAMLSGILHAARAWGWLASVPAIRMLPEPARRVAFLTRDEAVRLLAELPEHLADMAAFALVTGLRESNVCRLQWSEVDLERAVAWVWHDEAKAGRAITVPLSPEAVAILRDRAGLHPRFCFTWRGQPLSRARNHAWDKAKARAGIPPEFRWHDLRHTWATWHAMAGTPMAVLKELGGWRDSRMVERYAHFSPGHLAQYAGNLRPAAGHDLDTAEPVRTKKRA